MATPRSMVAFWMVGLEDRPERSAEICVAEIFGNAVRPGESTAVGMGLHRFRDPAVTEDFDAVLLFDFPEESTGDETDAVPSLVVDYLRGYQH